MESISVQEARAVAGLTSFVFHFSVITICYCIVSSVVKSFVLYIIMMVIMMLMVKMLQLSPFWGGVKVNVVSFYHIGPKC